jgi:ribonucleotide monophosphatase NagD (HAD superfamily)
VIAALEACTGRHCELHFGKPGRVMMEAVAARLQAAPEDCVVVGDRLSTDLAAARSAGAHGALVLTGETGVDDLGGLAGDERPDYVLERLDQLLPAGEWERRGWRETA